jgi:hypothetical protein
MRRLDELNTSSQSDSSMILAHRRILEPLVLARQKKKGFLAAG